jgi:hypothetical protein
MARWETRHNSGVIEQEAGELLALTPFCPLVKELQDAGVSYVAFSDLFSLERTGGHLSIVLASEIPVLGDAVLTAINYVRLGRFLSIGSFVMKEEPSGPEPILPICGV